MSAARSAGRWSGKRITSNSRADHNIRDEILEEVCSWLAQLPPINIHSRRLRDDVQRYRGRQSVSSPDQ